MLRLDRKIGTFTRLPQRTLEDVGLFERRDLQQMIATAPQVFFDELGEDLLFLAQEVRPAVEVDDRIDILALDEDGTIVIVELKRGSHKLHLLQALSYASMTAKWEPIELINMVTPSSGRSFAELSSDIDGFLIPGGSINHSQRIILVAEEFDYSVLVTAEWLAERYNVDIRCYRLTLAVDDTGEFLSCSRAYPPLEITAQARLRRPANPQSEGPRYTDWNEALNGVSNQQIAAFFREAVSSGLRGNVSRRILNWPVNGQRRFWTRARGQFAYGWQLGRFDGDINFWRERLGDGADVGPVDAGSKLRFRLRTAEQCTAFKEALQGPLRQVQFRDAEQRTDEISEPEDEDEPA